MYTEKRGRATILVAIESTFMHLWPVCILWNILYTLHLLSMWQNKKKEERRVNLYVKFGCRSGGGGWGTSALINLGTIMHNDRKMKSRVRYGSNPSMPWWSSATAVKQLWSSSGVTMNNYHAASFSFSMRLERTWVTYSGDRARRATSCHIDQSRKIQQWGATMGMAYNIPTSPEKESTFWWHFRTRMLSPFVISRE